MHTNDILDMIQERHSITSDNKLATALGVTRQTISSYRTHRTHLKGETALRAAKLLGVSAGVVLAWSESERAREPAVKIAWDQAAALLLQISETLKTVHTP